MPYNSIIDRTGLDVLLPVQYAREIIQEAPSASIALSKFRHVQMSSKATTYPVLGSFPTAYWVNGDTGLKQTSKVDWTNKTITAEELAVIVPIPEAVLADSEYDIWAEVKPRVVEAIGAAIDAAIIFGTNKPASFPAALVADAIAKGNLYNSGSVVGKDLVDEINIVMGLVEADGYPVNGFMADPTFKASLRGLRDANGNLIFNPSMTAGTPATLFGESIQYADNGAFDPAAALMIAGDWRQGIIGMRQDITFKMLDQAVIQDNTGAIVYNLAQQDMVALRCVMRVGFQLANPTTRYRSGKTTPYPFAVLQP